jgi:hypothetical protein
MSEVSVRVHFLESRTRMQDHRTIAEWFPTKAIERSACGVLRECGVETGSFAIYVIGYHQMHPGNSFVVVKSQRRPMLGGYFSGVLCKMSVPRESVQAIECHIVPEVTTLPSSTLLEAMRNVARMRNRSNHPRRNALKDEDPLDGIRLRLAQLEAHLKIVHAECEKLRDELAKVDEKKGE